MKSCLVRYSSSSDLTQIDSEILKIKLAECLKGRIKKAYLFGSFATGEVTNSSDVDLILIVETTKPFLERGRDFFDLYDVHANLDILIYTQQEFDELMKEDLGFWGSVKQSLSPLAVEKFE